MENHVKLNHNVYYNTWSLRGKEVKYSKNVQCVKEHGFYMSCKRNNSPKNRVANPNPRQIFFLSQQYYYMTLEDLEYGAQVIWTELLVFLELFQWKQSNCCEI